MEEAEFEKCIVESMVGIGNLLEDSTVSGGI